MATAIRNAARLRELLSYDPTTGVFTNRITRGPRATIGAVAGSPHSDGYLTIMLDGQNHLAHRLAWLYVYGEWPEGQIDHINRTKSNNWIGNLRDVARSKNQQNKVKASRNNKTGFLGVTAFKNSFRATIKVDGKRIHCGLHPTPELASEAYKRAKQKHHPMAVL